jgi:hypothetical protein
MLDAPPPITFTYPLTAIQIETGSKTIIVPGQTFSCPFRNTTLSATELSRAKLSAGQYGFYVFGEVTYRDVATQDEHITRVCWHYSAGVDAYIFCPTYNSAT